MMLQFVIRVPILNLFIKKVDKLNPQNRRFKIQIGLRVDQYIFLKE
jgi:hypothetical protein